MKKKTMAPAVGGALLAEYMGDPALLFLFPPGLSYGFKSPMTQESEL